MACSLDTVRMVPIPSMLKTLWRADWNLDSLSAVGCLFCVVPILLNSWWFYLMLHGMWVQFCGGKRKAQVEKKS